jgi:hypothetical protein
MGGYAEIRKLEARRIIADALPCGVKFDSYDPADSLVDRGHIYAAQAAEGIRASLRCSIQHFCSI